MASFFFLGIVLSQLVNMVSAASLENEVPQGQGQPIQISDLGSSAEIPFDMSDAAISMLEARLVEDLEKRAGSKLPVAVRLGKANGKTVFIQEVKFPEGMVTRYEGVSNGKLMSLTCDYSTSYPPGEVKKSCDGEIRKLFGEMDGQG